MDSKVPMADGKVVSIYVISDHWTKIKALAASEGLSASAWIRTAMLHALRVAEKDGRLPAPKPGRSRLDPSAEQGRASGTHG